MLYETAEGCVAPASDKILYVFYDSETTQSTEYFAERKLHVPNLVCVRYVCSRCEDAEDSLWCGKRKYSFLQDPVEELLSYLIEPCSWANKIVATVHNAKAFGFYFIPNRAIALKWKPELIIYGLKIMCTKVEHLVF